MEGRGEVIEWAVKMERLPEEATLRRLRRGEIGVGQIEELARRIAAFHAEAEAGAAISACGRFEVVARNARENFEESAMHVGTTISRAVFERLRAVDRAGPGRPRAADRESRRAGTCPATATATCGSTTSTSSPTAAAGRPGDRRLHRVQRAVPLCRPDGRHGLPGHGPRPPRPARPGRAGRRLPTGRGR